MRIKFIFALFFILFISKYSYSMDSTRVTFGEAMDAIEAEDYEKAVDLFTRYLKIASGHDEGYYQRGNAYYALKMYDKALNDYSIAYNMGYQKDVSMFYRMGMVYKFDKNYLSAIDYLKKAADLDKKNVNALLELGNIYLISEDFPNAKEYYNRALKLDPNYPEVFFALGQMDSKDGNFAGAVENYEKAASIAPDSLKYYYQLGLAYSGMKDMPNTEKSFRKVLQLDPNNGMAYYELATIYAANRDYAKAGDYYTNAINSKGKSKEPYQLYTERGINYFKLNDIDNALKDFANAIKLNGNNPESYLARGKILHSLNKDSLAFDDFTKAIIFDDQSAEAYAYRGGIYYKWQQTDLAEADLRKAVTFNPVDTTALFNLANVLYSKDDFQNALNYYIKTLKVNPEFHEVYENRGICYYNLGFYKLAAADFESAMKYDPALTEKLQPLYRDAKSR
jgi:tetratricopeptide (TPR) repeat protein